MGLFGSLFGGIGKLAGGLIRSTPIGGAISGVLGGIVGSQAGRTQPTFPTLPPLVRPRGIAAIQERSRAPVGIRIGGVEVQPSAALPGGKPLFRRVNGRALPFVGEIGGEPEIRSVRVRQCPRGQVLALDGRCYPKAMVPMQFREVRPRPKAAVTAADRKAIRRAAATKKRLIGLTKDAGGFASSSRPRTRTRRTE